MGWGSGGGGWSKPQGGGQFQDTRSAKGGGGDSGGAGKPGSPGNPINASNYVPNSGVPSNFPGALENHPNWVGDGGANGHCDAHPGGCKDSLAGQTNC